MKRLIVIVFVLFLIQGIFAACSEGQIDINSASAEELDVLIGVGLSTAQNIIDARPYINIDDLIRASGIAEKKLANIKEQGLACVDENEIEEEVEEENIEENLTEEIEENIDKDKEEQDETEYEIISTSLNINKNKEVTPIKLEPINSKDIKTEENSENLKRNFAIYGIITFCVVFIAMFLLRKDRYKNEFR